MKPLPVIQPQSPRGDAVGRRIEDGHLVRDAAQTSALEPRSVAAIKTVFDPEIPVNIHDLGLIYDVIVDASGVVGVVMTLTAPACPQPSGCPARSSRA